MSGRKLLLAILSGYILFTCMPSFGTSCVELFRAPSYRGASYDNVLTWSTGARERSADGVAQYISQQFRSFLRVPNRLTTVEEASILRNIEYIIELSIENAVQHGLRKEHQWNLPYVEVEVAFLSRGNAFFLELTNPTQKTFPESLQREFFTGDKIDIPNSERKGYRGNGIAVSAIGKTLSRLPSGSSVKWTTDRDTVTFRLQLPRPNSFDYR